MIYIEDSDMAEYRALLQEKDDKIAELKELVSDFAEATEKCCHLPRKISLADLEKLLQRAKEAIKL